MATDYLFFLIIGNLVFIASIIQIIISLSLILILLSILKASFARLTKATIIKTYVFRFTAVAIKNVIDPITKQLNSICC